MSDIEAIRDWYNTDRRDGDLSGEGRFYHARIGMLLTEIDRLIAERDKLAAELMEFRVKGPCGGFVGTDEIGVIRCTKIRGHEGPHDG